MQADEGGMLTMDDSRMSVGGSLLTMDDSRMSAGGACALMPEELAEWRVVGDSNSSLPSGTGERDDYIHVRILSVIVGVVIKEATGIVSDGGGWVGIRVHVMW